VLLVFIPDAGGRDLACGESVDLIVHHEIGKIYVPAQRVEEMVPSDGVAVAVAAGHDDLQFVVGELGARGHCQGATVQRMHTVGINISRQVGRAADAANGHHLMGLELKLSERLLERGENTEIPAAGTPIRVHFPLEVLDGQLRTSPFGLNPTAIFGFCLRYG